MKEPVTYGPFWDGYVAAVDRTLIGRNGFSEDSLDCGVDPTAGAIVNRNGSATAFDTAGALVGLLEAKFSGRVRQLISLESDSFADGQPNAAGLWCDDTDKEGQLWFRSTNGADSNQAIGKSYGTAGSATGTFHRSQVNATIWDFLMIPLLSDHATQIFTRCKDALSRRVLFSGAKKILRVGKGLLAPNRLGTPLWWNGRFNDAVGSGSEKEYVRPLGPMPPPFPVRFSSRPAASATTGTWKGSDRAIWSIVYEFENGDRSAPYLASPGDAITIDAGAPANKYDYVTLIVPPGPPDCVKRWICRTPKWDSTAATLLPEDPTNLLLCGEIRNRFQTLFRDYAGDDDSLRERPDVINFGLTMPPRARTVWTMDGRVVFGDIAPNLAVIELAPYCYDGTFVDTEKFDGIGAYNNAFWFFEINGTNLLLKHHSGAPGAVATVDLTFALSGQTLQNLVDTINAVAAVGGNYAWRAQLLPGADGNALCTDLQPTNGADYFDDDVRANDGRTGSCRVISGPTLPGVIYMKPTSDYATQFTDPRGLHFTMANPAATGTEADAPLAPNAWKGQYDCRRRLEGGMGRIVGGMSLLDGSLVVATNGVAVLRNVRGGKTGVDADYRLEKWKAGSGVLGWGAFAEGDGWGVYAERAGIMVNDGRREVLISWRVWNAKSNAGAGRGPWAYEFGQCKKWVGANDDSCHLHLAVAGSRIYVFYRSSGSVTYPDMYMYYDFSRSVNRIGVDQVLREDGQPYAWSAPIRIRGSQCVLVTRDDGDHLYTAVDDSTSTGHSTGDGHVVEIELTSVMGDDGATDPMVVYLQADRFDAVRQKKRVTKVDVEYYEATGGLITVAGSPDFARAGLTSYGTLPAVTDGTVSDIARLRPPAALRGPVEQLELKFSGTPTGRTEIRKVEVAVQRLNTLQPV